MKNTINIIHILKLEFNQLHNKAKYFQIINNSNKPTDSSKRLLLNNINTITTTGKDEKKMSFHTFIVISAINMKSFTMLSPNCE